MIQLKLKTEYSFRKVFGKMDYAVSQCAGNAVGIADSGTWGFVKFEKACKKYGKKPIYGFSCDVFDSLKSHRNSGSEFTFLAKNVNGLKQIYRLCSLSFEQFYWVPRILYSDLVECDKDIIIIAGDGSDFNFIQELNNIYLSVNPNNTELWINKCLKSNIPIVATSDIYYPNIKDEEVYDIYINDFKKTGSQFICSEDQFKMESLTYRQEWFDNIQNIVDAVEEYDLPKAENVHFNSDKTLEQLCREGIINRKLEWSQEYEERLIKELNLIKQKKFEDYFFVLSDLIRSAKKKMLVGPARGSSAGSLVCYLIDITDIDPLKYGLIFERFIDITREDLPDIDVDFPDSKRIIVMKYLKSKYGSKCFGHIGTVSEYKSRSALGEIGSKMKIPFNEMEDLKNTIQQRSDGDARAAMCIQDTFTTTDLGKNMLQKYPVLNMASRIEGHIRHHGKHAAGLVVLNDDIRNYASTGRKNEEVIQLDKKDAEYLNILKIDALGLRTLSVISDCLEQINMSREQLLATPLDDDNAFDIFNKGYYSGIFQFEGYALQNLNKQMPVERFDDIVAITTLARPGPLQSGGADKFINRRTGKEKVTYLHKLAIEETKDTYGVIIYQEQVMQIGRKIGKLSWEDVSSLRKAMSKSLGEDFFNAFWDKFKQGAKDNNIAEKEAKEIWENMHTFGCWAFNKSHAVSYGLISYWCAWLKSYYPLEYAAACLRNSKNEDQTIKTLRELMNEGFEYVPLDLGKSMVNWTVQKGKLIGGLTGVKGIGVKTAENIIMRRGKGEPYTPGQLKHLSNPIIPYADVFECKTFFEEYYNNPEKLGVGSGLPITYIEEISGGIPFYNEDGSVQGYKRQTYIFIGKLKEKNLRDLNEYGNLMRRGGNILKEKTLFLDLVFEDDTDKITTTIDRYKYEKYGKPIAETGKIDDFYLVKGVIKNKWRKIYINNIKLIKKREK